MKKHFKFWKIFWCIAASFEVVYCAYKFATVQSVFWAAMFAIWSILLCCWVGTSAN